MFTSATDMYKGIGMAKQADMARMYKDRVHEKRNVLDRVRTCYQSLLMLAIKYTIICVPSACHVALPRFANTELK